MQAVGLGGPREEQYISSSFRLAAAVTLSSGQVLLTGGKDSERKVFLLSGPGLTSWQSKEDMLEARRGHAAVRLQLSEEVVVVAGGWGLRGEVLASVEVYSVVANTWQVLSPLAEPRADFALQVTQLCEHYN